MLLTIILSLCLLQMDPIYIATVGMLIDDLDYDIMNVHNVTTIIAHKGRGKTRAWIRRRREKGAYENIRVELLLEDIG